MCVTLRDMAQMVWTGVFCLAVAMGPAFFIADLPIIGWPFVALGAYALYGGRDPA